jgi:hypothetical protein
MKYILLAFLFLLPFSYASLTVPLGENLTIYATTTNGVLPTNVNNVSLQVYFVENNSLWLAGVMTQNGTGTYLYELQPPALGWYQVILLIGTNTTNVSRQSFFQVTENNNMSIAIVIGIIFVISALVWLSKDFFSKPVITLPSLKTASKWLDMKVWGVFVMLAAMWGLVILLYFMRLMAEGTTYAPMLETLYFIGLVLMGALTLLYTAFFFVFQYAESIEKFRHVK